MSKIVVSLTTYKDRIDTIQTVIESINQQSVQPDIIALYLYSGEFGKNLPVIKEQSNLQIKYVDENLKGHKKYFYAFQEFCEDIVITLDDDIYYHKDTIKVLLEYHQKYPTCVIANRTRFITVRDNDIENYYRWEKNFPVDTPSMLLMGTGVLGILYPPHIFDDAIFDKENLLHYALDNDDIWLKIHEVRNGIKTVLTNADKSLPFIEGTQDTSLCHENYINNACNSTINSLIKLYNVDFRSLFISEFGEALTAEVYGGLYSKCYRLGDFLIKRLNFENSPENEYEMNVCVHECNIRSRRGFGFSVRPSIIAYDYLEGTTLNKEYLSLNSFESIMNYITELQKIPCSKFDLWNKYKTDCLNVLRQFTDATVNELNILESEKGVCIIHGDINPNNIIFENGELTVIDYENSFVGPMWWDKCYFLANYNASCVDSRIIETLSLQEIEYILLIVKVRIGRLIRKGMETNIMDCVRSSWQLVKDKLDKEG